MDSFSIALFKAMDEAETALGVRQGRLRQTAEQHGGVSAAKYYIQHNRISDGFDALAKAGRLDLTMEALVTAAAYHGLFSDEEVNACFALLCGADFY